VPLEYDFEESIGYFVYMAGQAMEKAMTEELAALGITYRQWQVLAWIAHDGHLAQSELADRLRVEAPTLVGILDRMERDGWIVREADPHDRRRKIIRPTDRVTPFWERMVACARAMRNRATDGILPEDLARTKQLLERILENLGCPYRQLDHTEI